MTRSVPTCHGRELPVGKILAVGRNYAAHAAEMNAPATPVVFLKPATAIRLPQEQVVLPRDRGSVHHELEIVVRLAKGGRDLTAGEAADRIGAYGLALDLTLRDVQAAAKAAGEPWTLAKGFDGSLPLGPLVPAEDILDPTALTFALAVNGTPRQQGRARDMIRSVPELIADISAWITWEEGDLLLTGTPQGVGPVLPGDRAEMTLDGHITTTVHFI